ncbi:MAG: putative Ig domain-containing protein [Blastocatellia bacterium]
MRFKKTWLIVLALVCLALILVLTAERKKDFDRSQLFSEADSAADFFRLKRLPEGETQLPVERYQMALRQMEFMPRYSTASGRFADSNALASPEVLGSWTTLGPGNIGGRTRAWLIHPTQPDTMFAAGVAGGVWKTTDGGASWTPISDLIANLAICTLAMPSGNPNVIYAGTGESQAGTIGVRGNGIFKTTDGGATWTQLTATANNSNFHFVNKLAVSPDGQRVYAATSNGVFRSLDGGTSWTQTLNQPVCDDLVRRSDQNGDVLFVACRPANQGTISRNSDAAGTGSWEPVLTETGMSRVSLALAPSNQNTVYAISSASNAAPGPSNRYISGLHAVFRSTDGGAAGSWTARVRNTDPVLFNTLLLTNPSVALCNNTFINQGHYDNVIAVDPVDANRVWVGGVSLFRSDDGGANWGLAPCDGQFHVDIHAIVFHPQFNGTTNKAMFVGSDGGVFRLTDSRLGTRTQVCGVANCAGQITSTSLNNSYGVTQFYHGLPYPDGKTFFGGTQDNGTPRGNEAAGVNGWNSIFGGDGGYVAIDPANTNVLYAATTRFSLLKSTNGGTNFSPSATGISDPLSLFIVPVVMDPNNSQRLWTGGGRMWRTDNAAGNWVSASVAQTSDIVSSIAVAPGNSNIVLAGTSSGFIQRTNAATTATATTDWPRVRPRSGLVSWLAFEPNNANVVYATYSTFNTAPNQFHVYKSIDGGASWAGLDGAGAGKLPDVPVHTISVDPLTPNRLYIGTDVGVFSSVDGGANWAVENSGFANVITEALTINTAGTTKYLFAFTHGRGAWRVELKNVVCGAVTNTTANLANGQINMAYNQTLTASGGTAPYTFKLASGALPVGMALATNGALTGTPTASGVFSFSVSATDANGCGANTIAVSLKIAGRVTFVSAASFGLGDQAPESIIAAFGVNLATGVEIGSAVPLPTTLRGTSFSIRDSAGVDRLAPLFFVSPGQVNLLMSPGMATGLASITANSGDGQLSLGTVNVANVAPSMFSANASGTGYAAAVVFRLKANGVQSFEPITTTNAQGAVVPIPIDLGPESDLVFLLAFGSGFRFNSGLQTVVATLSGAAAEVLYAGPQGDFVGLDQANIRLARNLIGKGDLELLFVVGGKPANRVRINLK